MAVPVFETKRETGFQPTTGIGVIPEIPTQTGRLLNHALEKFLTIRTQQDARISLSMLNTGLRQIAEALPDSSLAQLIQSELELTEPETGAETAPIFEHLRILGGQERNLIVLKPVSKPLIIFAPNEVPDLALAGQAFNITTVKAAGTSGEFKPETKTVTFTCEPPIIGGTWGLSPDEQRSWIALSQQFVKFAGHEVDWGDAMTSACTDMENRLNMVIRTTGAEILKYIPSLDPESVTQFLTIVVHAMWERATLTSINA